MQLHTHQDQDLLSRFRDQARENYNARTQARREALLEQRELRAAELREERKERTSQASSNLFGGVISHSDSMKAAAEARVQALKAQVAMMKQMATFATGDEAKAILRRLKHIAGQLKAAVAQYAQAGGSSSAGDSSTSSAAPASSAPQESGAASMGTAPQAVDAAPAPASVSTGPSTSDGGKTAESTGNATSGAEQTGQQLKSEGQHSDNGERQRDQQFKEEVAKIKADIEYLMRRAKEKLLQEKHQNEDLKTLMRELKEVDKLLNDISGSSSATMDSSALQHVQAAYSANLTTGTISNVQVNLAAPSVNVST